jgi:hypothetical protein
MGDTRRNPSAETEGERCYRERLDKLGMPAETAEGELSDDQAYQAYKDVLDGTAARRRAEQAARVRERDRLEKALQDARLLGRPLSRADEELRDRLRAQGY